MTAYLAEQSGAAFTGLDFAPPVIRAAQARTGGPFGQPMDVVGNMDALDCPAGSLSAVTAIDTLYFAQNLPATVLAPRTLLAPWGRLAAFWTHERDATEVEEAPAPPGTTALGRALTDAGLTFTVQDFTAAERAVWARSVEVTTRLRPEFGAEARLDIAEGRILEGTNKLGLLDRRTRFPYVATLPPRASGTP